MKNKSQGKDFFVWMEKVGTSLDVGNYDGRWMVSMVGHIVDKNKVSRDASFVSMAISRRHKSLKMCFHYLFEEIQGKHILVADKKSVKAPQKLRKIAKNKLLSYELGHV